MTRLLLDVSSHGFGHFAQSAPVVNALARREPDLGLTVRGKLPPRLLEERLTLPFRAVASRSDPGLVMTDALTVDLAASFTRYHDFHHGWEAKVDQEAGWLRTEGFDLVLADAPYRSLAAAARAGIPGFGLCSLDWAAIFGNYLGDRPRAEAIRDQILTAYRQALLFLQPVPHMPMDDLSNGHEIAPIAPDSGVDTAFLRQRLAGNRRLGLVSLGGIPFPLDPANWPQDPDTLWIVRGAAPHRHDQRDPDELGIAQLHLLAAADVVVTKPGYATFVEAACQGVDVLYLPRGDWPEEPHLLDWIHRHARAAEITRAELTTGRFEARARSLADHPRPEPPKCWGAAEAAEAIALNAP